MTAAACRLGDLYREGKGGVRRSSRQAFRWYAKSALARDGHGQNNLGACYEHGIRCQQSYAHAVKWYRRSAAQQMLTAQSNLGYCYWRKSGHARHGGGYVGRDVAEALSGWLAFQAHGSGEGQARAGKPPSVLGWSGSMAGPQDAS